VYHGALQKNKIQYHKKFQHREYRSFARNFAMKFCEIHKCRERELVNINNTSMSPALLDKRILFVQQTKFKEVPSMDDQCFYG
jgi:hypothetical protein